MPFRGAPCSDAAGRERSYGDLWQLMHNSTQPTTPVRLDQLLVSKFFNYRAADGSLHQVWLDDPDTLRPKFALAKSLGLRGVGVWNFDLLDYTSTDTRVRAAMGRSRQRAAAGPRAARIASRRASSWSR